MNNIVGWLRSTGGLGASHPHLGGYTSRHAEAAHEIEQLRARAEDSRRIIRELRDRIVVLQNQVPILTGQRDTLRQRADELAGQVNTANAVGVRLQREGNTLRARVEELEIRAECAEDNHDSALDQRDALNKTVGALRARVAELEECGTKSHGIFSEAMEQVESERDTLKARVEELERGANDAVRFQRHRDQWRNYALGKRTERPTDYLEADDAT